MDDYHRNSKEWGSKPRKQESRQRKGSFRSEGRRLAQEALAPVDYLILNSRRRWFRISQNEAIRACDGHPLPCQGCKRDLAATGHFPWCDPYPAGDVIECGECMTKHFVSQNKAPDIQAQPDQEVWEVWKEYLNMHNSHAALLDFDERIEDDWLDYWMDYEEF